MPGGLISSDTLSEKNEKGVPVPRDAFLVFVEVQSGGVNAVAQACGLRAIVKHVSEVSIAAAAFHFGALHPVAGV